MYYYVSEILLIGFFVFILVFLILRYLTKIARISEFDSLGILNINVATSVVLLIAFFLQGYIHFSSLLQISILIFSFYLGIYLTSLVCVPILKKNRRSEALEMFAYDNLRILNLVNMLLLFVITSGYLSFILFQTYSIPDARLLVSKSLRVIDIVRIGVSSVFPYYAIGLYLITKRIIFLLFIFLAVMVEFFSGSKGFLLQYIVVFFTLDALFNGKRNIKFYFKSLYLFGIFIVSAVVVKIFWGSTIKQAFMGVVDRIVSAGDIYYYAFISGDYTKLFGQYNLLYYILHPFTSIIGIRGYEWPIGALIKSTAGLEVNGTGPNPHLPILVLVLMNGNYFLSLLFSFLVGCFVCISRVFALSFISMKKYPPYWRIAFFSVFFSSVSSLYVDIGSFQFYLIGTFVITLIFSIFYEFILGLKYKRNKPIKFVRFEKEQQTFRPMQPR
ncbi:oligosaccharide repeat unit polymerase [Deferribacteraceae bacterium V6Fe1]|nr:oligosaccharide repeat unit polymerase [Deferribacteraceae bacterium V6Fe1]